MQMSYATARFAADNALRIATAIPYAITTDAISFAR
jgi:hypothetical protein